MNEYDVTNHYWFVAGATAQVYHSRRRTYVTVADATYQQWVWNGGVATRISSEADLWAVLAAQYPAGLPDGNTVVRDLLRQSARNALLGIENNKNVVVARAIVALVVDELYGPLQDFMAALKSAAASSSTFASFRTAVAAIPTPPERTVAQAKVAIEAKINAGQGD